MKTKKEVCPDLGKPRGIADKLCAVGLVGVLVISMAAMAGCQKQEDTANASEQSQEQTVNKVEMAFDLTAANWDKSTPIIVHITGTTADGKTIDVYHAFTKANDTYSDLPDGTYSVEYVSPINKDGSLYTVPAKQTVTIKDGKATITATLTQVPADQVTPEQATQTIEQIGQAVAKGDDTLKGDTGKKVISNAATNAAAAPNVSAETTTAAAEQATAAVDSTETAGVGASTGSGSSSASNTDSSNTSSAPSNGTSSGSSSGDTAAAVETQKTWVAEVGHYEPVYEQQWVPNMVTVPDYETVEISTCPVCGLSSEDANAIGCHIINEGHFGTRIVSWQQKQVGSHTEDQGYYQDVQTGTTYVVDVPGHWE